MQATTVAAQGEAKTDFNLAGFSLTLTSLEETVPLAKADLKKKVDELVSALESMKTKLDIEFVKNSIRSSSNVQPVHEWEQVDGKNQQVFKGHRATYNYSFQIDDLDKVSKVYDVLTSLDEVHTSSPYYAIKDHTRERLNKKALKHAFEKVTERIETECGVLGLNPSDFEIASWEVSYSDSHRSDRVAASTRRVGAIRAMSAAASYDAVESAMGGSAGDEDNSLELVAGQAQVTVNLEVGYARRTTQNTVKAQVVRPSNGLGNQEENHA